MYKTKSGFTIVELLIVIVVIGTLASITIVAYNGIQKRANTTSAEATAKQVYTRLRAYASINGTNALKAALPAGGDLRTSFACIGSGFVDMNGDGRVDCFMLLPSGADTVSSNTLVDLALQNAGFSGSGTYPAVEISDGTTKFTTNGAWIVHWSNTQFLDGEQAPIVMGYWISGADVKCGFGAQTRLDYSSGGNDYYVTDSTLRNNASAPWNATQCAQHIPNS